MPLVFEPLLTEPIGDASYLVGDDAARVAAVIDPQIDTTRYLEAARRQRGVDPLRAAGWGS